MGLRRKNQRGGRYVEAGFQMDESTLWWQSTQASGMKQDPCNHTRWKHKWVWHNRGCVWDKLATDDAGKEDWISKRKYDALEDFFFLSNLHLTV